MTTVFLDTETLGLDRMAPIWEFAAIRMEDDGTESAREHFQIRHNPSFWLAKLQAEAPWFAKDYTERYDGDAAVWEWEAARKVRDIVQGGALIAGSNPGFDMERLLILMQRNGIGVPGWHYHPHDIPSMATGWLAARGLLIPRPWKSNALSSAVGINPSAFERHTAMGDVEWTLDLYTAMVGTSNLTGGVW